MTAFDERLAGLRARFVARAAQDGVRLRDVADAGDLAEIRRIAHGLAGTAGTFGFPQISDAARAVEEAPGDLRTPLARLLELLDQPR